MSLCSYMLRAQIDPSLAKKERSRSLFCNHLLSGCAAICRYSSVLLDEVSSRTIGLMLVSQTWSRPGCPSLLMSVDYHPSAYLEKSYMGVE